MGCGCTSIVNVAQNTNNLLLSNKVFLPIDCDYTKQVIQNWYNSLDCIKKFGKINLLHITTQKVNSYLGYLQSALNYPDNYCFYKQQLEEFQLSILPLIITNVPECYNN